MEASITDRIAALQKMSLGEIRGEFEKVFGRPSLSRNRKVLVKRIAEKLQSDCAGSKPALEPALEIARPGIARPGPESSESKAEAPKPTLTVKFTPKSKAGSKAKTGAKKEKPAAKAKAIKPRPVGQRDPRLPKAGTTITREWHGKKYLVRVTESGFEYDGKPFRSLSGLARHITGQVINGFLWFGLIPKVADPARGKEGKKS